jgi:hypothetical protein
MKSKMQTYLIRRTLKGWDDKQINRLHMRIWRHIEKWYGTRAWDWPTLYAVYPQLACMIKAIHQELAERGNHGR